MLTDQEVNKVFSWLPYRESWTVERNQRNDGVNSYYGDLIKKLTHNVLFETYFSEDGGLGNYLEFICFPNGHSIYNGNAIIVCASLCAPIAAYGQTTFTKRKDFIGWDGLFSAENIYDITDSSLKSIETEIKSILLQNDLLLIDKFCK